MKQGQEPLLRRDFCQTWPFLGYTEGHMALVYRELLGHPNFGRARYSGPYFERSTQLCLEDMGTLSETGGLAIPGAKTNVG